ncbi:MAG: ATP-grasp domain-containing protein [Candidatus Zixiibacteriota bacterium]
MKVAIVYNRDSAKVINLFGVPNKERIGLQTIKRITDGLKNGGHQVRTFEGDKDLVDHLEEFMPRVVKGELPGMVFNVSYGIQGRARYTHVPGILEMVGIPYVGSGPLAHSLALDKVVAKMIFRQHNLPTPDFAVLDAPGFEPPDMGYPLIVKPRNEAVSLGLKVVDNETELRQAADVIFKEYQQPVLVEQYIRGREINVGLLGNNPPEVLPPVELIFDESGPPIYTYEDKTRQSGREIGYQCPAPIDKVLAARAQELALRAFNALGCHDCARVDMRLDVKGNLYILEVNSLPSLGEHGSYPIAARRAGLDFSALVCRLVEVASARYFGTPHPPPIHVERRDIRQQVFTFLVERRDLIEQRLESWVAHSSRITDPTGLQEAVRKLDRFMDELKLRPVADLTDQRCAWTWETRAGMDNGTLLIGHLDVPIESSMPSQGFRRDPEFLYGEGIGVSRAPLVMALFAMRALRNIRCLRYIPLGILYYADEGRDCRYSQSLITAAASRAKQVLVLRPGNPGDHVITQRRGLRKYRLVIEGEPRRLGKMVRQRDVVRWAASKLNDMAKLSSRSDRVAVAVGDLRTEAYPSRLPHRVTATVLVNFLDQSRADEAEHFIRSILGKEGYRWSLKKTCDRPPMKRRPGNNRLVKMLKEVAEEWEIPFAQESSLFPSAAGLVPASTAVVCGVGPIADGLGTPHEAVQRISLMQRTLLLAQFLARQVKR